MTTREAVDHGQPFGGGTIYPEIRASRYVSTYILVDMYVGTWARSTGDSEPQGRTVENIESACKVTDCIPV